MEKIKVMVNDVLNLVGSTTIRNIISHQEMELIPVSVTNAKTKEKRFQKMRIDQNVINLITPEEVAKKNIYETLFSYGRPDVVVDCSPESLFLQNIPDYLAIKTSFVFFIPTGLENEIKRLKKQINNLGVNLFIFCQKPTESEIMMAIKLLYQKQLSRDFGKVFVKEVVA